MDDFFELVINYFIRTVNKNNGQIDLRCIKLNVYLDWLPALLVIQVTSLDHRSEVIQMETEPSTEDFQLFYQAYLEIEEEMREEGQKTDFQDVIFRMQHHFLDYTTIYGYDKNIPFIIAEIPLAKADL